MEIIVRATVIYFFLWAVTRGVGKRELSEMTAFELILLVTMGDLIQQGATQNDVSLTGAGLAVGTLALWILVFAYLSYRFKSFRSVVEGVPWWSAGATPSSRWWPSSASRSPRCARRPATRASTTWPTSRSPSWSPTARSPFLRAASGGDQQGGQEKHMA